MRTLLLAAILLLPAPHAHARQDEPRRLLDPGLVPAEGRAPSDFVPRGWKTETDAGVVTGDLNRDGAPDAVLRLVEDAPAENAEGTLNNRSRALVVLLAKPGGGYGRAAVAAKLLGCTGCHGVLGDPAGGNIQVEIKNGVLNVNQLSGSREATDLTQRFRHDAASGRFLLIGEDVSEYDRAAGGGKSTSTNYLTGARVTKTTRVLRGGRESTTSRTTRVRAARRYIEDVDYEQGWEER
ncbi:MAG TPA: hypothetical protein VF736_14105 [Pyrinomonadaceae bacterium]|jgi:hypothetical protein